MRRSKPFARNNNAGYLYGLGLVAQLTGEAPSKRVGILDSAVAYAFDWMIALQMNSWRDERELAKMEALAGAAPFSQGANVELINGY